MASPQFRASLLPHAPPPPRAPAPTSSPPSPPRPSTILIFGDADMSFSYDLCRFCSTLTSPPGPPGITVTAYDSEAVGVSKYATLAPHVKKILGLRVLSKKMSKKRKRDEKRLPLRLPVDVQVHHGVDCLDPPAAIASAQYSQIIFNHPHLGVESATSHTHFLHHFFHTVKTLNILHPQGSLLATFAGRSQADRWDVTSVARSHGFHLNSTKNFAPPYIDSQIFKTESTNAYATFRRGHSGKSFNTNDPSITLVFTFNSSLPVVDVPWMVESDATASTYECLECNKKFSEKRNLINHLKDSVICSSTTKSTALTCDVCGDGRTFVDLESLKKHVLQKHTSTNFKPPEYNIHLAAVKNKAADTNTTAHGCEICGVKYSDEFTHEDHAREFKIDKVAARHECEKCGKTFREMRSLTQHKNLGKCRNPCII